MAFDVHHPLADQRDLDWMHEAIRIAKDAARKNMLPFGCVIVGPDGEAVARAGGTGSDANPLDHSEMLAIEQACLLEHRVCPSFLQGYAIYSTAEPCLMCCGGIGHAKLSRVVFGSYRRDLPHLFRAKLPAEKLLLNTSNPPVVIGGMARGECIDLFQDVAKWDSI